jgi:hypothetical protein
MNRTTASSTSIISYYLTYIYIYTGGGLYRGYMGYRPFIDSPLDSIDMIDSMILWIMISILFLCGLEIFRFVLGYMNQRGIWGVRGLKCAKPGFRGF